MTGDASDGPAVSVGWLLLRILSATSQEEALSLLTNEARALAPYDQAAFVARGVLGARVLAVSNLTRVDNSAPYSVWLRRFHGTLRTARAPLALTPAQCPQQDLWDKMAPPHLAFVPVDLGRRGQGAFLAFRQTPWRQHEIDDLAALASAAAAHIVRLRQPGRKALRLALDYRKWIAVAAIVALCFVPVRMSTIAPAEVIPQEPAVIAASLSGVIKRVHVKANDEVRPGQLLVEFDDVEQRSRVDIASRALESAEAELARFGQMGFLDPAIRAKLGEQESVVQIRRLELERARDELARTRLHAERPGIALVGDGSDLEGKPVQVGEKILLVADPRRTAVRLWVPVHDGALLAEGGEGRLFLDSEPWSSRKVRVRNWVFEPEATQAGGLAFRTTADWGEGAHTQRIGLRGSAHLEGRSTPLVQFVLRRPIIFLRQSLAL
jgi:hypothetical protein